MRRACAFSLSLGMAACSSKPPDSGVGESGTATAPDLGEALLLAHDDWAYLPPEADPFYDHPADAEPCPSVAYVAENGFIELETDYCAVATFSQETRADLVAGSRVRFVAWNLDLWAPEPYEALRFLQFGETQVWAVTTPVPGNEDVTEVVLDITEDFPAGTPVWFHLENHGINSWRIGDIERL